MSDESRFLSAIYVDSMFVAPEAEVDQRIRQYISARKTMIMIFSHLFDCWC
jgi:hypothetical protein